MNLGLDQLSELYQEQLFFELTPADRQRARSQLVRSHYPHPGAYENAYINWLCLNKMLAYLEAEPDLEPASSFWPDASAQPPVWSVVNGSALQLGSLRLVLVPSQAWDLAECRIPREWLELPGWAGHYFAALQVDDGADWIHVWGYATHQQVRSFGQYDPVDETYGLPLEALSEDLSELWVARDLGISPQLSLAPVPSLSPAAAQALLDRPNPTPYSPRLDYPFEQWAALVVNPDYRQRLYEQLLPPPAAAAPSPAVDAAAAFNDLGQWLRQGLQTGWQTFDAVLGPPSGLAFAFRQSQSQSRTVLVEGVKLIDLGVQLGHQPVALVVGITSMEQQRVGLQVQLLPTAGQSVLPAGIALKLLSPSGSVLQTSVARSQDSLIQLKRFSCPEGRSFALQVELGDFRITETFQISPSA